jgi:hypothetical protein
MLYLLRKIRRSILSSSASHRLGSPIGGYMLYALGEFILIVVGILVAMEINNWNEWRKDRDTEQEILQELKETLQRNAEELKLNIERTSDLNQSRDVIISLFSDKSPYSDTLETHFSWIGLISDHTVFDHSGYEMLKNEGFDLVSSVGLRKEIVHLFEISAKNLYDNEREDYWNVYVEELLMYMVHNFKDGRTPNDFESLLNDSFFVENIKEIQEHEDWLNHLREGTLTETERVLQLIKIELGENNAL